MGALAHTLPVGASNGKHTVRPLTRRKKPPPRFRFWLAVTLWTGVVDVVMLAFAQYAHAAVETVFLVIYYESMRLARRDEPEPELRWLLLGASGLITFTALTLANVP